MRFTKKEWENFMEIGNREESFSWDIPSGYIQFGIHGMSVHKLVKGVWYRKDVNDWRSLSYTAVNEALRLQEWDKA